MAAQSVPVLTVLLHVTEWRIDVEGMFTMELYAPIRRTVMIDGLSRRDAASGLAIASIHAEPDGGCWPCSCRSAVDWALQDIATTRFKAGKRAKYVSVIG